MFTFRLIKAIFVLAMLILLNACIVFPIGVLTEDPYTKEKLDPLFKQNANRSTVRKLFGAPEYTKENQRYWFYTNQRETWGVIAGTGSAVFTKDKWLIVEFNEIGNVVFVETADFNKCVSNGICLGYNIYADPVKGPIKPSNPKENECAVYLYLEKLPFPLFTGSTKYSIDGRVVGTVDSESYLFLTHHAGEITISAYDMTIKTRCEGGKRLYVKAVKKKDMSWETGEDLAPVSEEQGERKIKIRHPALRD